MTISDERGPCITLPVAWVEELLKMQDTADLMFVDFEIIESVEREVEQVRAAIPKP